MPLTFRELTDVDGWSFTTDGQTIAYDYRTDRFVAGTVLTGSAVALSGMADVHLGPLADSDLLLWSHPTRRWINTKAVPALRVGSLVATGSVFVYNRTSAASGFGAGNIVATAAATASGAWRKMQVYDVDGNPQGYVAIFPDVTTTTGVAGSAGGASALSGLVDLQLGPLTDGDLLLWSGPSRRWINTKKVPGLTVGALTATGSIFSQVQVAAASGFGTGNSLTTGTGTASGAWRKMRVYDVDGNALGFMPIFPDVTSSTGLANAALADRAVLIGLMAAWSPAATGADDNQVPAPFDPSDGISALSWTIRRLDWRASVSGSALSQITLQKSLATTSYAPSSILNLALSGGLYEAAAAGNLGTIQSGEDLRLSIDQLGGASGWTVQVTLEAPGTAGTSALSGLLDTAVGGARDGDLLVYRSDTGRWTAQKSSIGPLAFGATALNSLAVTGIAETLGTNYLYGATNASGVVNLTLVDGNNASALYPLVLEHRLAPGVSGSTQAVGIDWYSVDGGGSRARFAFVKAFLNSGNPFGTALSFNTFTAGAATENLRLRNAQAWMPHDLQVDGDSALQALSAATLTVSGVRYPNPTAADNTKFLQYDHPNLRYVLTSAATGSTGSGTSTTSGNWTARPAAGTDGRLYLPTDAGVISRDNGIAWNDWGPVWLFTTPTTGLFTTWVNSGATTFTAHGASCRLTTASGSNSGDNARGVFRTLSPTSGYTVTMLMQPWFSGDTFERVGMALRDSGSGKFYLFYFDWGAGDGPFISATKWTNTTTFSAAVPNFAAPTQNLKQLGYWSPYWWLRIRDDGSNLFFEYSPDRQRWLQAGMEPRTTWTSADQVGIMTEKFNGTKEISGLLLSWRQE
jgi:hypothetical protein